MGGSTSGVSVVAVLVVQNERLEGLLSVLRVEALGLEHVECALSDLATANMLGAAVDNGLFLW